MDKQIAYRKVRAALRKGVLSRPSLCARCGVDPGLASDGRAKIQAHHADYSKPLDVEWICAKCHRDETPMPENPGGISLGERNGQSKLNADSVLLARRLRAGGMIYREIAEKFGVDKKTIMRAIKGEQWAHVNTAAPAPQAEKGGQGRVDQIDTDGKAPPRDAWRRSMSEMTPEQRVDEALDSVLQAAGSALRYYTMPKPLDDMRAAMRRIMSDSYIAGSNDARRVEMRRGGVSEW